MSFLFKFRTDERKESLEMFERGWELESSFGDGR